jgi:hypothetical protein
MRRKIAVGSFVKIYVNIQRDGTTTVIIHQMITPNEKENAVIQPDDDINVISQSDISMSSYIQITPNVQANVIIQPNINVTVSSSETITRMLPSN